MPRAQSQCAAIVLGFAVSLCSACGGQGTANPQNELAAPDAASSLRFYLAPFQNIGAPNGGATEAQLSGALEAAFASAGYTVDERPDAPHDVVLRASVTTAQADRRSIFQVGAARLQYKTVVSLVVVAGDGHVIDQARTEYELALGEAPTMEQMQPLVFYLRQSGRLAQSARDAARRKADAAAFAERQAAAAADAERFREEAVEQSKRAQDDANKAEWNRTKGSCGADVLSLDACDPLRAWLARNAVFDPARETWMPTPQSQPLATYIADAAETLRQAEPALTRLREARDWSALDLSICAQAKGPTSADVRTACAPAATFLHAYPTSVHAPDVRAVLDPSEQRVSALEAQEEREAKRKQDEEDRKAEAERKSQEQRGKICFDACWRRCMTARPGTRQNQMACVDACTTFPPENACQIR